jgi:hypothetical protein
MHRLSYEVLVLFDGEYGNVTNKEITLLRNFGVPYSFASPPRSRYSVTDHV